jgi:3-hydroxyacyl-[acyl-carrier-protein] dehydratase
MRFLFVDRIEHVVRDKRIRGFKTVSFEEAFLPAPAPVPGEFPRLLLLEAVAQLASWLVLYSTDFEKLPLLAKLERVEIFESVYCGDRLTLEVEMISRDDDGALLQGEVLKDGRPIARGRNCLCGFTDLDRLAEPELIRAAFKELTQHAVVE